MVVLYDAYGNGNFSAHIINLIGEHDTPIIIKETGNEDHKDIIVRDKNNTIRYQLIFSGGKLRFASYNASGSIITEKIIA